MKAKTARPGKKGAARKIKAKASVIKPSKAPVLKKGRKPAPVKVKPPEEIIVIKKVFKASQLKEYKLILQRLRDRVVDEIAFLAGDNLNRSQKEASGDLSSYSFHMADQGTDNFDREFSLNLVSSEQDILYEIDDALRRIDLGSYGACEECGDRIGKERLKALPFAKMCIQCKEKAEKGKSRFRPFGPTISQATPTAES